MTKAKFLVLILIGAMFGSGAFFIKDEAESGSQTIETVNKMAFEACKKNNEFAVKYDVDMEQRDCEKEYLD